MRPLPRSTLATAAGTRPRPLGAVAVTAVVVRPDLDPDHPVSLVVPSCALVSEFHPALVAWLEAVGWTSVRTPARWILRPAPGVPATPGARILATARGATPSEVAANHPGALASSLRLSTRRAVLASRAAHWRPVHEILATLAAAPPEVPVVADPHWFALERAARHALVALPCTDNPARALLYAPGGASVISATEALAEVERVHLHQRVAVHPEVLDVAALAAAAPASRPGLFDAQDACVSALLATDIGAVLAAPPGSGKTVVTAVALAEASAHRRVLIAVPAALTGQWAAELARWAPDLAVSVAPSLEALRRRLAAGGITVTTHDVAARWGSGARTALDLLVVDEAAVVAASSARARGLWRARGLARVAWALTGTPSGERHGTDALAALVAFARARPRRAVAAARTEHFGPLLVGRDNASSLPTVTLRLESVAPDTGDLARLARLAALTPPTAPLAASAFRDRLRRALGDPSCAPEIDWTPTEAASTKRTALVAAVAQHCATDASALVHTASTAGARFGSKVR